MEAAQNRKYLHFLSNGGVFLKKQIHVDVKVTGGDTPGHPSNHLRRKTTTKTMYKELEMTAGLQIYGEEINKPALSNIQPRG